MGPRNVQVVHDETTVADDAAEVPTRRIHSEAKQRLRSKWRHAPASSHNQWRGET